MPAVDSSNIERVDWDSDSKILTVAFLSGGVYEYSGVDEGVYQAFLSAGSKGRYFHYAIKGRYPASRVG